MIVALVLLLFRIVSAAQCGEASLRNIQPSDWDHCTQLTSSLLLYFGVQGDFLKLAVFAEGHAGWSAIGIGGNGGMKGASQIVVRKDVYGEWVAEDRYSLDYVQPAMDSKQDVLLLFAEERPDYGIEWGVLLPLDSCDVDDYPIKDFDRWVHWALGSSHKFDYHSSRGQIFLNLVSGPKDVPPDIHASEEYDLRMPSVPVETWDGQTIATSDYKCGVFDMEQVAPGYDISRKRHMIKITPLIDPSSSEYPHHMILYKCFAESGFLGAHGDIVERCPFVVPGCTEIQFLWGPGYNGRALPEIAGMPVGGGQKFFLLQMHYYNPFQQHGVVDSSGVRLTITDNLRQHDAEFLYLRYDDWAKPPPLPAGMPSVTPWPMTVPPACTEKWSQPINIMSTSSHAHAAGIEVRIDVSRGSEYIGRLSDDRRFDYYHHAPMRSELTTINPGDAITLSCTYNTSDRVSETYWGESGEDEMCVGLALYFPKQHVFNVAYLHSMEDQPTNGSQLVDCMSVDNAYTSGFVAVSDAATIQANIVQPTCARQGNLSSLEAQEIAASSQSLGNEEGKQVSNGFAFSSSIFPLAVIVTSALL